MVQAGLVKLETPNERVKDGSQFSSFSRGRTNKMKQVMGTTDEMPTAIKENNQWDLTLITYTKLFPKLIENGLIEPVYLAPLKCLFPKWYDTDARCDYHVGISCHSTKNCNAFKYKVQDLIKLGKFKFEELNRPAGVEDLYRVHHLHLCSRLCIKE